MAACKAVNPELITISPDILYIGVDDLQIDLFESQYPAPQGMSYNSYLILDEKVCIMDTTDPRTETQWEANLHAALAGREPDYLVSLHVEPDHAACVAWVLERYSRCQVVCSAKAAQFLTQFSDFDFTGRVMIVKEGDKLELGKHSLQFFTAAMVHWPEVMMAYEATDKVLFTADAFGKFGALCNETEDWATEARRYYCNICGKYGPQVQSALKKAHTFDVRIIAPLHGPVLRTNLEYYGRLYQKWSKYEPETEGVFIAHSSLHGNTAKAAELLAEELNAAGVETQLLDLCRQDVSEAVARAFQYGRIVLAAPTYDGGLMPKMEEFIQHLKSKGWRNRRVALIENGTWAPMAGKLMRDRLSTFPGVEVMEEQVTVRSALKPDSIRAIKTLAKSLAE
ncbi:MAG: FprA family A-type flavoprotein [Bacteroidales bacterium]|nr:FprA family A-type flavoprotein [Bacteroidales bacterium]